MANIKILIGACIRQEQSVLEWYWKSLLRLQIPDDTQVEYCFVDDSDGEIDWSFWTKRDHSFQIINSDPRPKAAKYSIGSETHQWKVETFEHLAKQKQKIFQYALDNHFDYFFLVDSDLLLEPTTLLSAISFEVPIVNSVFWTSWQRGSDPLPQVWLKNPYELHGLGMQQYEFLRDLAERRVVRVIGGGACTLFDTRVLSHIRYHPRFENLPDHGMWQGEDRTLSITCQQNHIDQWADPWPNIFHAYHKHMRTDEVLSDVFDHLVAPRQLFANYGDLVSFEVTALDLTIERMDETLINLRDPRVKLVRGRLGSLRIAPEIEAALFEMSPGQSRIISVKFPYYIDIPHYTNTVKMMKLTLHDVKAFGFAPVLNESLLSEVS